MKIPTTMTRTSFFAAVVCLGTLLTGSLSAADDAALAAVKAADAARVKAMQAPTKEALEAVLSDDLNYAHSSGGGGYQGLPH